MKTHILIALVTLLFITADSTAQTLEIWRQDSTGTPEKLTGNQVTVEPNTKLYLRAKNVGLPPGTNPNRRYEFFWDMGNGVHHKLSSNQIVTYKTVNGKIKPRLVLKGIYSDEDLRVVNSTTEVIIGNGQVGAEVVTMDDTRWIEIEQLNDLRNSRLVSYHLKYSNRYNPDGAGASAGDGKEGQEPEGPEQDQLPGAVFDLGVTDLTNYDPDGFTDLSLVERSLAPANLRSIAANNPFAQLVEAQRNETSAATISSPAFELTFKFPLKELSFYGIDQTSPIEPMLLKVGSNLAQLISLDTTSSGDTGIITIEAIPVAEDEKRQILLTFITKSGLSQNTPVEVSARFEMSEEVLDVLGLNNPPQDSHTGVTIDSHDPNAKTVDPAVFCKPIPFEYKIYFENEGFAEANRIWIIDSIDGLFDYQSLTGFGSSDFDHLTSDTAFKPTAARTANIDIGPGFAPPDPVDHFPMTSGKGMHIYKDETNRKVVWVLNQIDLPHPEKNPDQTKGWVSYEVQLRTDAAVSEGDEIYTPALIYFDSNDPVSTLEEDKYATTSKLKKQCPTEYPWYLWLILLMLILIVLWLVGKFVKKAA